MKNKSKNKTPNKIRILTLLALFIFMLPLSGCGYDSLLDPKDPIELTFWHVYGEQAVSPMAVLVDEFNTTLGRERGVHVRVTAQSSTSRIGKLLEEGMIEQSDADMPDIFTCHLNNALELGAENLLDWNNYFTTEQLSTFVPEFLADGQADGQLLVFPVSKSTHMLMFNGTGFDRFSAATGVTYDDLTTWEGLYAAAAKYYNWSDGGVFCAMDYPIRAIELNAMEHGASDFLTSDGWYNFDDPIFKESWMQFARSLVQGHVQVADLYSNTQVMTGDTLGGLGSSAAILYYNDIVSYPDGTTEPMDLHILPTPMTEGATPLMTQAGVGIAACKTTEQKAEAAALFVDWLTQPERNLAFVSDTGYMPVRTGAFDNIDLTTYDFPDESYVTLYTALKQAHSTYTPVSEPNFVGYYDDIYSLYNWLRQVQKTMPDRVAAGEDIETLAEETWTFFRSIR